MTRFVRSLCALGLVLLLLTGASALAEDAAAEGPSESAARSLLEHELKAWSAEVSDPWTKQILSGTAITAISSAPGKDGTTSVQLTVAYPLLHSGLSDKVKFVPGETDYQEMLRGVVKNMKESQKTMDLAATEKASPGGGSLTWASGKGFDKLKRAILADAAAANKSYNGRALTTALTNAIFPHAQRVPSLTLSPTLESGTLTAIVPDMDKVLQQASDSIFKSIAMAKVVQKPTADELREQFTGKLATLARQYGLKSGKSLAEDEKKQSFTFDLHKLAEQGIEGFPDIVQYQSDYKVKLEKTISALEQDVASLPDYPVVKEPRSGMMEGSRFGEVVRITRPNGTDDCVVFFRYPWSDIVGEIKVYVHEEDTAIVRITPGEYIMEVYSGKLWYGDEHFFGPNTKMEETNVEIKEGRVYYTISLPEDAEPTVKMHYIQGDDESYKFP